MLKKERTTCSVKICQERMLRYSCLYSKLIYLWCTNDQHLLLIHITFELFFTSGSYVYNGNKQDYILIHSTILLLLNFRCWFLLTNCSQTASNFDLRSNCWTQKFRALFIMCIVAVTMNCKPFSLSFYECHRMGKIQWTERTACEIQKIVYLRL